MAFNTEDFDEEEFDELIEAETPDEEEENPAPKKKSVSPPPARKPVQQAPARREPILEGIDDYEQEEKIMKQQKPVSKPTQPQPQQKKQIQSQPRFAPYILQKRYGIMDNTTGQPYVEAGDSESFIVALLSDILNKLNKIEESL